MRRRKRERIERARQDWEYALSRETEATMVDPDDWSATMDPEARVAVLAVCLMLKNRNDAADVSEGSHVEAVIAEYERIKRLQSLLGHTTDEEVDAATALYELLTE